MYIVSKIKEIYYTLLNLLWRVLLFDKVNMEGLIYFKYICTKGHKVS